MEACEIRRLNLVAPIYYSLLAAPDPFARREAEEYSSGGERLFCFELDEAQSLNIEPDKTALLGALVFGGTAAGGGAAEKAAGTKDARIELPRGNYLFAQTREILARDGILSLAAEIQAEGLWQRLTLGKRLYLRFLFEDSSGVTQVFRPYSGGREEP